MNKSISSIIAEIVRLSRSSKRMTMLCIDVVFLELSLLVVSVTQSSVVLVEYALLFFIVPVISIPLFYFSGFYRVVHRYIGARFLAISVVAVSSYSGLLACIAELVFNYGISWIFYIKHWVVSLGMVSGGRIVGSKLLNWYLHKSEAQTKIAIYGAGSAGVELMHTLIKTYHYAPLAFIDDKSELRGNEIFGVMIYSPDKLGELTEKYKLQEVFVAIPSASKRRMSEVVEYLARFPVKIKTVPPLLDIISGRLTVSDIRDVCIEDLLGRDPVLPDETLLKKCIKGKAVLVTGAGGSIGSELASQIVSLESLKLILYEVSEAALYHVESKVKGLCHELGRDNVDIIPVLGSVLDERKMRDVIRAFGVETIYHAAAYKHVPMVEMNPISGVSNNLFGTWHAVRAALDTGVETFIFISTDKAVRPTSVMGASKRLAELVIQGAAERVDAPRFSIVRFGNVLGSSGSIVPLVKEQIRKGGPVTVTHPEVVRYFMSIPEAAQLVIQAGSLGENGDVFVLDMGEPVKIINLVRRMVCLSGLTVRDEHNPAGDIEIVITGLRPGEKLYEELLISGDNIEPTEHPRIMRAREEYMPWPQLMRLLSDLEECCKSGDVEMLRKSLLEHVSGYIPQCNIKDPVWLATSTTWHERKRAHDPLVSSL